MKSISLTWIFICSRLYNGIQTKAMMSVIKINVGLGFSENDTTEEERVEDCFVGICSCRSVEVPLCFH